MLRFISFFLALVCLAIPVYAEQPNGCPDYSPPVIVINQLSVNPQLNDTFDLEGLRQFALDSQKDFSSTRHETPVGLTAASLKLDTHFEINVRVSPDDPLVCAQIKSFQMDYGFDDTMIYLARELPNGSCSYHTVLEHEQRHVAADENLVRSTTPFLKEQLRGALARIGVIRASSPQVAETQIHDMISGYMKELGKNLSVVRQKHQSFIDTPQEYDRLSHSCNGTLADLIRASRRR